MAEKVTGAAVLWVVLLLLGAIGNAIGLMAGKPMVTLIAAPLMVIGLIGVLASRRKASRE